jgi:hypothetical protein
MIPAIRPQVLGGDQTRNSCAREESLVGDVEMVGTEHLNGLAVMLKDRRKVRSFRLFAHLRSAAGRPSSRLVRFVTMLRSLNPETVRDDESPSEG